MQELVDHDFTKSPVGKSWTCIFKNNEALQASMSVCRLGSFQSGESCSLYFCYIGKLY